MRDSITAAACGQRSDAEDEIAVGAAERARMLLDYISISRRIRWELVNSNLKPTQRRAVEVLLLLTFDDGRPFRFVHNPQNAIAALIGVDDGDFERAIKQMQRLCVVARKRFPNGVEYRVLPDVDSWSTAIRRHERREMVRRCNAVGTGPQQTQFEFDPEPLAVVVARLGLERMLCREVRNSHVGAQSDDYVTVANSRSEGPESITCAAGRREYPTSLYVLNDHDLNVKRAGTARNCGKQTEDDLLNRIRELFARVNGDNGGKGGKTDLELSRSGAWHRINVRAWPDDVDRVLGELNYRIQTSRPPTNPGAWFLTELRLYVGEARYDKWRESKAWRNGAPLSNAVLPARGESRSGTGASNGRADNVMVEPVALQPQAEPSARASGTLAECLHGLRKAID